MSVVSWTVRLALLCYTAATVISLLQPVSGQRTRTRIVRPLWTAGALLFLAHVAAAFHFEHHWSHAAAIQSTAVQTEQLIGVAFGEGLWFSYLFVLLWTVDVAWSWIHADSWQNRTPAITVALHAWLFFIAFNGAVIFESGPTRPAGMLVTGLLAGLAFRRLRPAKR
ncbi:MAG: hypothetical protein ACKO2P_20550 [Planctomycetota bacterium]